MTFNTNQIVFLSGCTERIVQWWDERDVVRPDRKVGHRRMYGPDRTLHVCILQALRKRGFSLQQLRKVNSTLSRVVCRHAVLWFATDGIKTAGGFHDSLSLATFLCSSKEPMLVIDVECHRQKIERLAEKLREKAQKAAA